MHTATIIVGDNRETLKSLAEGSVQCVVTSPPYWGLRDYGEENQIGLEVTPELYVEQLCQVFDEVWRVLADDGTLWLNLGDSYNRATPKRDGKSSYNDGRANRSKRFSSGGVEGLKTKDLIGIPWRVAFALQARGWYLRSDIVWHKPNPMPESVTDRPTRSHEYIFLLTKSPRYYYDNEAIKEETLSDRTGHRFGGEKYNDNDDALINKRGTIYESDGTRNKRDVWTVSTRSFSGAHFAVYPIKLIEPCILAGSREGDTILDPFSGSGTTGIASILNGRNYIGAELNPEYAKISENRIAKEVGFLGTVEVIK